MGRNKKTNINVLKAMKKQKIYISGKITGDKHYRKKFYDAERKLKSLGYEVLNPARMIKREKWKSYRDYLQEALLLLFQADGIYMLPDWTDSCGAKAELTFAMACTNYKTMFFVQI